jgi:hypothetical protein
MRLFERYIGVDYSGAETADSTLPGLRVYLADCFRSPVEVKPPSSRGYWTRRGIAEWLEQRLGENIVSLIGIDHGFSFPVRYFERHGLSRNWTEFLEDFQRHWPTDEDHTYVDLVREGVCGNAKARCGDARWRRLTEMRAGRAKSVFHFDVPGSVAKSTHAGLPWLLRLRQSNVGPVHFWPFDGWQIPRERSVVSEVYPSLWSKGFSREDRTVDQHDSYSIAEWMTRTDSEGLLPTFFDPVLSPEQQRIADIEGWILGVV